MSPITDGLRADFADEKDYAKLTVEVEDDS